MRENAETTLRAKSAPMTVMLADPDIPALTFSVRLKLGASYEMYELMLPLLLPVDIVTRFVLMLPWILFARKDVSDIHSLTSHDVSPFRIDDVYENVEKLEPLTETLSDPVEAVFPHRCELRVACQRSSDAASNKIYFNAMKAGAYLDEAISSHSWILCQA